MAIKINDEFSLEGRVFDWVVVRRSRGVNKKTGKEVISEKRSYFPRLSQVANHIIGEEAKAATDLQELVEMLEKTTASVEAVLGGVEERIVATGHRKISMKDIADGEGESDAKSEKTTEGAKQRAAEDPPRKRVRVRKKKAS